MIFPSPITGRKPKIHPKAFIAQDAVIIGDVEIGENANIWYGVKIRGDVCKIKIGKAVSVQENTVIHSEPGTECIIGDFIIIGHAAMVHGPSVIEDYSMIGLSSTILQGSKVGKGAIIAGGAVLKGEAEPFHLYAGVPAKKKKFYGESRIESGKKAALNYVNTASGFKQKGYSMKIPDEYLIKE